MTDSPQSIFLVRMAPPAKGDTIHTSACRYALLGRALRWTWADEQGWENIDWAVLRRRGFRICKVCHPELLREDMNAEVIA